MSEVKIFSASDINRDEWRDLQALARDAFTATLNRSQNEVDALVAWDEPEDFYTSHTNPNVLVGNRYNDNQEFSKPLVAVATDASEPVGFAYAANNVSGSSKQDRMLKSLTVIKNYFWMRDIAVKPNYQHRGIAKALGRSLLSKAIPLQPVTAYVWPDEISFLHSYLEQLGFNSTDESEVRIYGEQSTPVRQLRMQASSARKVLNNLR